MIDLPCWPIWPRAPPPNPAVMAGFFCLGRSRNGLAVFVFHCPYLMRYDTGSSKRTGYGSGATLRSRISLGIFLSLCGCRRVPPFVAAPIQIAPSFISATARIKRSVIPVVCAHFSQPGNNITLDSIEGTAFFVRSDGMFATANHVITGLTNPARRSPCQISAIYVPLVGWQPRVVNQRAHYSFFTAAFCTVDANIDVAVCGPIPDVVQSNSAPPDPVSFESALQDDGTPTAFTGFPLGSPSPVTSRGFTAAYRDAQDERGPRELIIDKTAWPGASGSPIYIEDGRVIGIVLARGTGEGAGIAIGRPASFIERLLAERQ
jgi:S1-C subfamily serine protease